MAIRCFNGLGAGVCPTVAALTLAMHGDFHHILVVRVLWCSFGSMPLTRSVAQSHMQHTANTRTID